MVKTLIRRSTLAVHGLLCLGFGFPMCAVSVHAAEPPLPPALKAQVQRILQHGKVGTAAVLLVDGLGISGAYLHGAPDANACAELGAAGDAVLALAAIRLAERGKADLYRPLPLSMQSKMPAHCKAKVTLGHLLEHTSGISQVAGPASVCPGSVTAYSRSGMAMAALALEKTTQTRINKLVDREVFKPLGMHASSWGSARPACLGIATDPARSANHGTKYTVVSTPFDMAHLVQMLVLRGQVNAREYLPQCAVERMGISMSAVSMPGGNTPTAIEQAEYGLGLARFKAGGQQWLGYAGNADNMSNPLGAQWVWGYSSQTQSGMVIMIQSVDGVSAKTLAALKTAVATDLRRDAMQLTQR